MTRFLVYGAGAIMPRLSAFLAVLVFSHMLSISDFGLYALTIAVGEFCDMTASVWYRGGFMRFYHTGRIGLAPSGFDLSSVLIGYLGCNVAGVLLVWPVAYMLLPNRWVDFGLACSVYVVAAGSAQIALSIFRGEAKHWAYLLLSLRSLVALLAGIAVIWLVGASYIVCALSVFGSQAVIGVLSVLLLWYRRRHGENTRPWLPELLGYAWPILFSCILFAVMNITDRSLIQFLLGTQAVALYAASYSIGRQPIDMLCNALNLATFTDIVKVHDLEGHDVSIRIVGRQIVLVLAISLPAAAGLSLLSGSIAHVLFDSRYWAVASSLVPPIAFATMTNNMKNIAVDQVFYMMQRTGIQVLTYLPSLVIMIVAGFIFMRYAGLVGIAYALLFGNVCSFIVSIYLANDMIPLRPPLRDLGGVLLGVVVMGAVVWLLSQAGVTSRLELAIEILAGATAYATIVFVCNVLGLRSNLWNWLETQRK